MNFVNVHGKNEIKCDGTFNPWITRIITLTYKIGVQLKVMNSGPWECFTLWHNSLSLMFTLVQNVCHKK